MIRLGKDKVDERFNILTDGTIVDLEGSTQQLNFQQGRFRFKGIGIHKIQMYTNYGYRNSKIWDIHHLDENPLNNSLNNLVFLTHSEHSKLHHSGKRCSEETKMKISRNRKGILMSDKTKAKMSEAHKNPTEEIRNKISKACKGLHKGKIYVNNGIINKRVYPNQIPDGFVKGRIKINRIKIRN